MPQFSKSIHYIVVAVFASLAVGFVVGVFVCGALLGLTWWAQVPLGDRSIWAYWPATGVGVSVWIYILWLFLVGEFTPKDILDRFQEYLRDE